MNRVLKNSLVVSVILVLLAGMTILLYFSRTRHEQQLCKSVETVILDDFNFSTEEDLEKIVENASGVLVGQKIKDINLFKIEKSLELKCDVDKAEAWITPDGVLHITVSHKVPACLFVDGNKQFYADASGYVFPVPHNAVVDVPVLKGPVRYEPEWITAVMSVVNYCPDGINHLIVDKEGELLFKRDSIGETFIFGKPENKEIKFYKYEKYMKQIRSTATRNYSTVDLRFDKLIICK